MNPKSIKLHFKSATSNKDFNISLSPFGGGWVVNTQNGKHGGTMTNRTRTPSPVDYMAADKIYEATLSEKRKEGYKIEDGGSAQIAPTPIEIVDRVDTGVYPQTLNEIDRDEAIKLCNDPRYVMQIKHDGRRLMIDSKPLTRITGINKKGEAVEFSEEISRDVAKITSGYKRILLDNEDVANVAYAFDLLYFNGVDIQGLGFMRRYETLKKLLGNVRLEHLKIVPVYQTTQEKLAALLSAEEIVSDDDGLKYSREEGVVFKLADSPYTAGKPNSGGSQFKYKFVKEADVVVGQSRDGKRSVSMWVYGKDSQPVFVGNSSISLKYEMPTVGSVGQVRYLYANRGTNNLFQPRWRGGRTDKDAKKCLLSQLVYRPSDLADDEN